jgi:hypothetical protein
MGQTKSRINQVSFGKSRLTRAALPFSEMRMYAGLVERVQSKCNSLHQGYRGHCDLGCRRVRGAEGLGRGYRVVVQARA